MVKFNTIRNITRSQRDYVRSIPEYVEMINEVDKLYARYVELTEHNTAVVMNEDGTFIITPDNLHQIVNARRDLNQQITKMNVFVADVVFHITTDPKNIENVLDKKTGLNRLLVDKEFK